MSEFALVVVAAMLGVPLIFGGILAIILFAGRARPHAGLGVQFDGTSPPTGRWNAQLLADSVLGRMGGTAGALAGQFEVADGELRFFPENATRDAPLWAIPCHDIAARPQGMAATAGVLLWSSHGRLACNVSREHLNVWTQNSLKTMREPKYYREFVDVLVAQGARRA